MSACHYLDPCYLTCIDKTQAVRFDSCTEFCLFKRIKYNAVSPIGQQSIWSRLVPSILRVYQGPVSQASTFLWTVQHDTSESIQDGKSPCLHERSVWYFPEWRCMVGRENGLYLCEIQLMGTDSETWLVCGTSKQMLGSYNGLLWFCGMLVSVICLVLRTRQKHDSCQVSRKRSS